MNVGVAFMGDGLAAAAVMGVWAALGDLGIKPVAAAATGAAALPAVLSCAGASSQEIVPAFKKIASFMKRKISYILPGWYANQPDRAERLLRAVLRCAKDPHICSRECPCAVAAHALRTGQDWVSAPLPRCEAIGLRVDHDIPLPRLLRANMTGFQILPLRCVENDCLVGGTEYLSSLIWPLRQMGAERILMVHIREEGERAEARYGRWGAGRRVQGYPLPPDILPIEILLPSLPPTREGIEEAVARGYRFIHERPFEIYDHVFFPTKETDGMPAGA